MCWAFYDFKMPGIRNNLKSDKILLFSTLRGSCKGMAGNNNSHRLNDGYCIIYCYLLCFCRQDEPTAHEAGLRNNTIHKIDVRLQLKQAGKSDFGIYMLYRPEGKHGKACYKKADTGQEQVKGFALAAVVWTVHSSWIMDRKAKI